LLSKHSPSLLRERMASPVQRDQKPWDRVWLSLFVLASAAGWRSWGGTPPATALRQCGLGSGARRPRHCGQQYRYLVDVRGEQLRGAGGENPAGPEGDRHRPLRDRAAPDVRKRLVFLVGLPLLLGSWIGLAFSALFILGIAWRAVHEERTLRADLSGYEDYTHVCVTASFHSSGSPPVTASSARPSLVARNPGRAAKKVL